MKGGPREWARTKTEEYAGGQWPTFADFVDDFKEAYKPPNEANRARIELEKLNQAKLNPPTVTALNARFRTLVSKAGLSMTDTTLIPIYKKALGHDTLSVIYIKETLPTTLEGWLAKAQEVNGRNLELSDIRGGGKGFLSYSPSHKSNVPDYGEPMDIDAVRTGPPRPDTRSCYNCGGRGHISRTCPSPRTQQQGAGRGGGGWQGGRGGGQGGWQGGRGNQQQQTQGPQTNYKPQTQQVRATQTQDTNTNEAPKGAMERIYAILAETSEEERDRAKELIKDF